MDSEWHRIHGHEDFNMPEGVTIPEGFEDITYVHDEMPSWAMYHDNYEELREDIESYDAEDYVKARINIGYLWHHNWHKYNFEWYDNPIPKDTSKEPIGVMSSDDWSEVEQFIEMWRKNNGR